MVNASWIDGVDEWVQEHLLDRLQEEGHDQGMEVSMGLGTGGRGLAAKSTISLAKI